jgi:hypothetical protein
MGNVNEWMETSSGLVRGGPYHRTEAFLRSSYRSVTAPSGLGNDIGFRVVEIIPESAKATSLVFSLLSAPSQAAEPALQPVTRLEYLALFESALPNFASSAWELQRTSLLGPLGNYSSTALRDRSILAGLYLAMWRETSNQTIRDELLLIGEPLFDFLLTKFLEPANEAALRDPFTPIGIFGAGYALDREGKLTGERREQFHKLVLLLQTKWGKQGTVGNWATAVVMGQLYAVKVFPDDPDLVKLRKDVDDYCRELFSTFRGDFENAPHYGGLSASLVFQFAEQGGNLRQMDTPFYRELYTRSAKLMSPNGLMPSFGDNYFYRGYVALYMYIFEAAARTFDDPRFLALSRLIYNRAIQPASRKTFTEWDATWMIALLSLPPYKDAPDPLPVFEQTTEVLHHFRNHSVSGVQPAHTEPDKLLLKVPGSPIAPYAMIDVGTGGHGALECRGAVLHYEINGVPLHRGTEKNPFPSLANLVYLKPPGRQFPHMAAGFEPGTWYTQTIALEMLLVDYTPPFLWDAIVKGPTQYLYLDNIRLEGPGGTQMLEACESTDILAPWEHRGEPAVPAYELSNDRTEGEHSVRIPLVDGRHGHEIVTLSGKTPFDRSKFEVLKFDWKYEGSAAPWVFTRWPNLLKGDRMDVFPWWEFYPGTVESADAAGNAAGDGHGRVAFSSYVTPDTTWIRDIVLTREGVLVIYDRVMPGPMAKDYTIGSLWQLDDVTRQGTNWFAQSTMDWPSAIPGRPKPSAAVLVWHAPAPGRRIGSQSTKESPNLFMKVPSVEHRPITTFAAETAVPGETLAFITVVAPWAEPGNPAELAEGITAQFTTENAEVQLTAGGVELQIQFAADGSWRVERPN